MIATVLDTVLLALVAALPIAVATVAVVVAFIRDRDEEPVMLESRRRRTGEN